MFGGMKKEVEKGSKLSRVMGEEDIEKIEFYRSWGDVQEGEKRKEFFWQDIRNSKEELN